MKRESLEFWRTLVPGVLLLAYLYLATVASSAQGRLTGESWFLVRRELVLAALAVALGYVYRARRFRDVVFKPIIERVQANIKARLLEVHAEDPYVIERRDALLRGRSLLEVFYKFVDSDASLREKAKGVRANGLALSSAADLQVISFAAFVPFLVISALDWFGGLRWGYMAYGGWRISTFAILAAAAGVFGFIARTLLPSFEKRHLELSNEQLDFIALHLKSQLRDVLYSI